MTPFQLTPDFKVHWVTRLSNNTTPISTHIKLLLFRIYYRTLSFPESDFCSGPSGAPE